MTGKEYLKLKIIKEITKVLENNGFEIDHANVAFHYNSDEIGIYLRSKDLLPALKYIGNEREIVYFYFDKGINLNSEFNRPFDRLSYKKVPSTILDQAKNATIDICTKINKETILTRFTLSKSPTIAQLRKIYPDIPKDPKEAKPLVPEGKDIQGHPDNIAQVTKCVRIKIKDKPNFYTHRIQYRMISLGALTKDKKRFTFNAPLSIGVQHSSELTFLNKEDAQEFIDNNKDFFSQYNPRNIEFGRSQTYSLCKVPVLGSDKAYATKDYIDWRIENKKAMPI